MNYINVKIKGIPYCQNKHRGNVDGREAWKNAIIIQTKDLPKVSDGCIAKITFLLPGDKFPSNYPFGPDLDNLLKRFLDALNETIFSNAPGKDSCVISLTATKIKVDSEEEAGAWLEILPIEI